LGVKVKQPMDLTILKIRTTHQKVARRLKWWPRNMKRKKNTCHQTFKEGVG
jgi:hypothetical protein